MLIAAAVEGWRVRIPRHGIVGASILGAPRKPSAVDAATLNSAASAVITNDAFRLGRTPDGDRRGPHGQESTPGAKQSRDKSRDTRSRPMA
jgi:hypothetical protein